MPTPFPLLNLCQYGESVTSNLPLIRDRCLQTGNRTVYRTKGPQVGPTPCHGWGTENRLPDTVGGPEDFRPTPTSQLITDFGPTENNSDGGGVINVSDILFRIEF